MEARTFFTFTSSVDLLSELISQKTSCRACKCKQTPTVSFWRNQDTLHHKGSPTIFCQTEWSSNLSKTIDSKSMLALLSTFHDPNLDAENFLCTHSRESFAFYSLSQTLLHKISTGSGHGQFLLLVHHASFAWGLI